MRNRVAGRAASAPPVANRTPAPAFRRPADTLAVRDNTIMQLSDVEDAAYSRMQQRTDSMN